MAVTPDNGEDTISSRTDVDPNAPKTYAEAVHLKQAKSAKAEADRLKHNRNAEPGYKLDNRDKEEQQQNRVKRSIALKHTHRPVKTKRTKQVRDRMVQYRGQGYSYPEIAAQKGMPSLSTLEYMTADDPSLREECNSAYDGYVRAMIERQVKATEIADQTVGLGDRPVKMIEKALKIEDAGLRDAHIKAASVLTRHGSAVASARLAVVGRALQIGAQKLPNEWGYNRDTGQEVIVIETPTSWMADAATGRPEDPDGQGSAAADARAQWREMRDVTPK